MVRFSALGLLIACAILIGALFLAFSLGSYPIGIRDLFEIIAAKISVTPPISRPACSRRDRVR
jgi:hypothetical protein